MTSPSPKRRRPLRRGQESLEDLFLRHEGRMLDKWTFYFEIYERHFAKFRGAAPTVLEIGISHGGSLDLWRSWFGRKTQIIGIDIEPRCKELARRHVAVEIGDQADPEFLAHIVEKYGPFDVIIDDGCHWPTHQIASFEGLWDSLVEGGVYLVEDTHTNYWLEYEAALLQPDTFVEYAKMITDGLTAYHSRTDDFVPNHWTETVDCVHFYDSMIVFDRRHREIPTRIQIGRPVFTDMYGIATIDEFSDDHLAKIAEMGRPSRRLRRALRSPGDALHTAKQVAKRRLGR